MKASRYALELCWAVEIVLECTPDASRATTIEEVDDANMERINLIGTKKQVLVELNNIRLISTISEVQQHRCVYFD